MTKLSRSTVTFIETTNGYSYYAYTVWPQLSEHLYATSMLQMFK